MFHLSVILIFVVADCYIYVEIRNPGALSTKALLVRRTSVTSGLLTGSALASVITPFEITIIAIFVFVLFVFLFVVLFPLLLAGLYAGFFLTRFNLSN